MNSLSVSQINRENFNSYQQEVMNTRKTLDSELLFSNGDIVFIRHKGEQYSLRRTRNGKLILNK